MARSSSRHAETLKYLLIVLFLRISGAYVVKDEFAPELNSLEIKSVKENADSKQVTFEVRGRNLQSTTQIKATKIKAEKDSVCEDFDSNFNFSLIENNESTKAQFLLTVPKNVKGVIYFCLPRQVKENSALVPPIFKGEFVRWYHQGPDLSYHLPSDDHASDLHQIRRSLSGGQGGPPIRGSGAIQVYGLRLEHAYKDPDFDDNGVPDVLAYKPHQIRLFGEGFTPSMLVTFTAGKDHCLLPAGSIFHVESDSFSNTTVVLTITLPPLGDEETFYICVKDGSDDPEKVFMHQGTDIWLQVKTHETLLPMWASILIILICICFSSLFSGLNLGLMSMDKTELKILCNTGTAKERKYAQTIQPVRAHGNYLLCSILLGNVLVNSIFTILLDGLTSGLFAVVGSTLAIVLFGEISPQAVCSRHGLAVGAHTIWITKAVMALTFPLSYPTAKFLDWMLGEEIGNVYTRERLKELVKVTTGENDLDKDEVNIISGALELRKKTVEEVMTRIEDVFMLDYDAVLDFETVSEIMKSGYSRIPVYEGTRQNIVTVLYIKDLAFVDPDDNTPLKTLCQFYQNPCNFVFEDVTLDVMFKIFKEGNKGHMAFVQRVNNEGEGDPFYETIGLITLEDVIEELIQAEIMDETDVFTDNRTKRRRNADRKQDFTIFAEKRGEASKMRISPQLTLAAYQFLSTSVEPFHPNVISETILRRLLKQDIVYHIRKNKEWRNDPACIIYDQGRAVDYFVIILEGRVEVTVGKESLRFEGGPFTYFGTQALVQTVGITESPSVAPSTMGSLESLNIDSLLRHTFVPDYTVRACSEVVYLKIKRSLYLAAKRATLMERSRKGETQTEQQFDEEVDKYHFSSLESDDEADLMLLHSLDEDDALSGGRHSPKGAHPCPLTYQQRRKSSQQRHDGTAASSPRTPSHHQMSAKDINGAVKSSPVDDIQVGGRDEEMSLLPKKIHNTVFRPCRLGPYLDDVLNTSSTFSLLFCCSR